VVGKEWPGSQAEKLARLFNTVLKFYAELGTDRSNQISNLAMGNFCNPKKKHTVYPCLSGIKARHVRYLVPVALQLCEDALAIGGSAADVEYRRCRLLCVNWLNGMYKCMDNTKYGLTAAEHDAYDKATLNLVCYTKCSKICFEADLTQWNIVPK